MTCKREQQCIVGKLSRGRDKLQNTNDILLIGRVQLLFIGNKAIFFFPPSWKMIPIYGVALDTFGQLYLTTIVFKRHTVK